ncbi:hypothetical protein P3T76_015441 [Phytophthora citrophthora]|uniref:Uncharacterized protein n=1 Tax=Phytophthora citrophthora TaxID=4793 RepID=A0AAD9FZI3_9STRA|nr:hypothetical protein P3T76_015441 [Phytophthora citrophthora]
MFTDTDLLMLYVAHANKRLHLQEELKTTRATLDQERTFFLDQVAKFHDALDASHRALDASQDGLGKSQQQMINELQHYSELIDFMKCAVGQIEDTNHDAWQIHYEPER